MDGSIVIVMSVGQQDVFEIRVVLYLHPHIHSVITRIDYSLEEGHQMTGMKMPTKYVVEMFCDRVAACKNYRGNAYTDGDAYDYYQRSKDHYLIHPQTAALLEFLLKMLRDNGEEKTLLYIKYRILRKK